MIDTKSTFNHLFISTTSVLSAVQKVRQIVEEDQRGIVQGSNNLINMLIGRDNVVTKQVMAIPVAQQIVVELIKLHNLVEDVDSVIERSVHHVEQIVNKPSNKWMYFYTTEQQGSQTGELKEIGGVEVTVTEQGKVKRGGKQLIVESLFKQYVLEADEPCDNACFVKIIMEHAGMSLAGARTYAYNCRKAHNMTK